MRANVVSNAAKMTTLTARPTQLTSNLLNRLRDFWSSFVREKEAELPEIFPVKLRDPLLTATETRFFQVLCAVAGQRVTVQTKIRLADLFHTSGGNLPHKQYTNFYKQIASRSVDFVLCDGEEYIFDPTPGRDRYFFGSDHFGRTYKQKPPPYRYAAAILLDMVGGKNARFPIEQNSWRQAHPLVRQIWGIAAELKCDAFVQGQGPEVQDDHLALNRSGIPAIDIIDFDYEHWHLLSDTPDKCSAESMANVAKVLMAWLEKVK